MSLSDEVNFTHSCKLEDYLERDTAVWDKALLLGYNNSDYRFWQADEAFSEVKVVSQER